MSLAAVNNAYCLTISCITTIVMPRSFHLLRCHMPCFYILATLELLAVGPAHFTNGIAAKANGVSQALLMG